MVTRGTSPPWVTLLASPFVCRTCPEGRLRPTLDVPHGGPFKVPIISDYYRLTCSLPGVSKSLSACAVRELLLCCSCFASTGTPSKLHLFVTFFLFAFMCNINLLLHSLVVFVNLVAASFVFFAHAFAVGSIYLLHSFVVMNIFAVKVIFAFVCCRIVLIYFNDFCGG